MKKLWSILLVSIFVLTLFVSNILASACCAERGHYSIRTSKPSDFVLDTMKEIILTSANLYTNAGYPDNVQGRKESIH